MQIPLVLLSGVKLGDVHPAVHAMLLRLVRQNGASGEHSDERFKWEARADPAGPGNSYHQWQMRAAEDVLELGPVYLWMGFPNRVGGVADLGVGAGDVILVVGGKVRLTNKVSKGVGLMTAC